MALSRVKTWVSAEVLYASDLNAEFNNILNNGLTVVSPLTGDLNVNSNNLLNPNYLSFVDSAVVAGAAGRLQRNGTTLSWHDGTAARPLNWTQGANIASAAALALGNDGNYFVVTGTTTITSMTSLPAGLRVLLRFNGALTLTYNATSLILLGGISYTTVAGDLLEFVSEGSGNWRELDRKPFVAAPSSYALRSYLAGLTLSNDGASPNTVIDVAAGVCTDSTNVAMMTLGAFTGSTGGTWVVGSGNNKMDTGAIASATWYYVWVIMRADTLVVDILFSLSATAPTMPANYGYRRRIGSFRTAAASTNILGFTIDAGNRDVVWWNDPATNGLDFSANSPGNNAASRTAFVPRIAGVVAIINVSLVDNTNSNGALYISPLTATDSAASNTAAPLGVASETAQMGGMGQVQVRVDGSAQFRTRVSGTAGATTTVYGQTVGWIDRCGRDA